MNLAPNPGFETPMPEISTSTNWTSQGWTSTGISAGHREITQVTTEHHGGSRSICLTNDNSAPSTYTILRMAHWSFDCHQGETWRVTAWVKGTGQFALGMIYAYNTVPPFVGQLDAHRTYNIALTGDWQQITVDFVIPANVERIGADMAAEPEVGGTVAYVDDVTFRCVPAAGAIEVSLSNDGGVYFIDANMAWDDTEGCWKGTV